MSSWFARYTNDDGEYEITFRSMSREKARMVEKLCCRIMDEEVEESDEGENNPRE